MTIRVIILGCGSSMGVPRVGGADGSGDWGNCDPNNPKNRRTRSSIIVQRMDPRLGWQAPALTTILVDTSPDLRAQLLANRITRVDAVLITHDHADQTHGIDDLRVLSYRQQQRLPVFIDPVTAPSLSARFSYCFRDNSDSGYPAIFEERPMAPAGETFAISGPSGDIVVSAILQHHGSVDSLGFIFGDGETRIAYSSDVHELPAASLAQLSGCDTYVVDALRHAPHPSHAHLEKAVGWVNQIGARHGVLTNMHIDMDYDLVMAETPDHVEPAYDGMIIKPTRAD